MGDTASTTIQSVCRNGNALAVTGRMIELGLARIARLASYTPQPWRAIHVAGTNGKGTICAYVSAMLTASGVHCGRFTSPHLIDRWDCVAINDRTVREVVFREAESLVLGRNRADEIGASEFELLTATAFEAFLMEKIEMGVIEVGLGGRLDATNVMTNKAVTVISKIGLDHQGFLGNTIGEIALQKAGIMRPDVPCVVDSSNDPEVLEVVYKHAKDIGTKIVLSSTEFDFLDRLSIDDYEPHQRQNLACAYTAFKMAHADGPGSPERLIMAIRGIDWPGRLQTIDLRGLTGRTRPALLDGAHNPQSAEVLGSYVNKRLRQNHNKVTWVFAASQGKELEEIFRPLLQPTDSISAVNFGPVDGMPWVQSTATEDILAAASPSGIQPSQMYDAQSDLSGALRWATETAAGGPIIIAGSLYLVSDVLRLLRDAELVKSHIFD